MHGDDPPFADRADAGRRLAARLAARGCDAPVVLALPRGGVPVAAEIAARLRAPLDLLLVRKIGAPRDPEVAVAAVADGDPPIVVTDDELLRACGAGRDYVTSQVPAQVEEIARRRRVYLGGRGRVPVAGRTVIVVDDGIATGTTARAALQALAVAGPARRVLAVPVAAPDALAALRPLVDEVVCLAQPAGFRGVGGYYRDFHQLGDAEVIALLDAAARTPTQ